MEDFKALFTTLHQTFDAVERALDRDVSEFLPTLKIYNPKNRTPHVDSLRCVKAFDEEMMEHLESLETRFARLRHHRRVRHARAAFSLAPISALPSDVIPIIFRMVVPDCIYSGCVQDAMRLSQVCTMWRGVALSMKDLWRNINIPFSRVMDLGEYLTRSGNRPLHVNIYERDDDLNEPLLLGSIFENMGAWSRIRSFELPYDLLVRCLAETGGVPWSTPILQSLTIRPTPTSEDPAYQEELSNYAQSVEEYECFDAPLLQQVILGSLDGTLGAPRFSHIRSLTLESYNTVNVTGLCGTISRYRNTLETLAIHSHSTDHIIGSDIPVNTISVLHLRALTLRYLTPQFATALFSMLEAPLLRSLVIHPQVMPWLPGQDPFMGSNGPLLGRLHIFVSSLLTSNFGAIDPSTRRAASLNVSAE